MFTNESPHDKTNKMAWAPSEDSDQPGHPPSLIRVFAVRMKTVRTNFYLLTNNHTKHQIFEIEIMAWKCNHTVEWIYANMIWAPSSEFVSSSIPSWQISTAHAQPFRGARDLAFCLKVPLDSLLVWASSKGSGETARMRRLAWTFAARIGDKYQIRLTRSIWFNYFELLLKSIT